MTCSPCPTKLEMAESAPSCSNPNPSSFMTTGKITEVMLYCRWLSVWQALMRLMAIRFCCSVASSGCASMDAAVTVAAVLCGSFTTVRPVGYEILVRVLSFLYREPELSFNGGSRWRAEVGVAHPGSWVSGLDFTDIARLE